MLRRAVLIGSYPAPLRPQATHKTVGSRASQLWSLWETLAFSTGSIADTVVRWRSLEVPMTEELPETIKRWTAKRRSSLVLTLLRGETSAQEAARQHGLTVAQVEDWKEQFLLGAENALRSRPKEEKALQEERIKKLQQKVGELVLDLDIYKEAMRGHPFGRKILDES